MPIFDPNRQQLDDTAPFDVLHVPSQFRKELVVFLQTGLSAVENLPEGLRAALQKWIDEKAPSVLEELRAQQLANATLQAAFAARCNNDTAIFVNGRRRYVPNMGSISYEEVVILAGMNGEPTMTYQGGGGSGTLLPGQSVKLYVGMIFNAAHTGAA